MKCLLCKLHCSIIKDFDLFGKEPALYYKTKTQKTTWIGRIFSFSFVLLYIGFFIYKLIRMMEKVDVTFYDTFKYAEKPPAVKINRENFYGGFALEHPITYDVFIDEGIYFPKAYFKRAERKGEQFEWEVKELELERCKLESFGSLYKEKFQSKDLNNLYCFKDMDYILEGHFSYDLYSFFFIQFFPCVNTTEKQTCKPLEEIDYYLKSTFVSFQMEDIELNPHNYSYPIRARDYDFYTTVGKRLFKEIHSYFQVVQIETDMDFLGFDEFENIKTETFLKYDEMEVMSNLIENDIYETGEAFCEVTIKLGENVRIERRTYTKLITIIGDVGGVMEVVFGLFKIVSSFSVDILYEISLVNNLFHFDLNKKQIIFKEKKKKEINEFPKDEEIKAYSPAKQPIKIISGLISINEEIASTVNRMQEESPIKNRTSKEKIIITKSKKRKPGNKLISNLTPYNKSLNSNGVSNKNLFSKNEQKNCINLENLEEKNNADNNTININYQNERENTGRIVNEIKINRACIYLCFLCVRRRKTIPNTLLDEGMRIITEKLDVFNLFERMYIDELMQKKALKNEIIGMSDECKIRIREILSKLSEH